MEYTLYGKLYSTDITELYLPYENLTYIDPNIKYFINLQTINLSCNKIKEIPKEIGYLTQLQILNLSHNQIHTQLECTFEEVLQAVLLEINNLPNELQIEVKNRLNEEMEDGLCKCFTGRISRLVNSLSGYSDKVSIKISSAEEIGNVISIMKDKYGDNIEEIKINVEKELIQRGYEKEIIDEWISYI